MKLSFVVYQIFTNFDTLRDVLVPVRVKTRKKRYDAIFQKVRENSGVVG